MHNHTTALHSRISQTWKYQSHFLACTHKHSNMHLFDLETFLFAKQWIGSKWQKKRMAKERVRGSIWNDDFSTKRNSSNMMWLKRLHITPILHSSHYGYAKPEFQSIAHTHTIWIDSSFQTIQSIKCVHTFGILDKSLPHPFINMYLYVYYILYLCNTHYNILYYMNSCLQSYQSSATFAKKILANDR